MEKVEEDLVRSKSLRENQAKEFSLQLDSLRHKYEQQVSNITSTSCHKSQKIIFAFLPNSFSSSHWVCRHLVYDAGIWTIFFIRTYITLVVIPEPLYGKIMYICYLLQFMFLSFFFSILCWYLTMPSPPLSQSHVHTQSTLCLCRLFFQLSAMLWRIYTKLNVLFDTQA